MSARGLVLCRTAAIVALAACARQAGSPAPPPAAADAAQVPAEGATLEVENNSTLDVRVFLLRAGMQTRLGSVAGLSTVTFELKPNMIDREVRLYANPVGGSARTITETLVIRPGQTVSWKLDPKLRSYRIGVY